MYVGLVGWLVFFFPSWHCSACPHRQEFFGKMVLAASLPIIILNNGTNSFFFSSPFPFALLFVCFWQYRKQVNFLQLSYPIKLLNSILKSWVTFIDVFLQHHFSLLLFHLTFCAVIGELSWYFSNVLLFFTSWGYRAEAAVYDKPVVGVWLINFVKRQLKTSQVPSSVTVSCVTWLSRRGAGLREWVGLEVTLKVIQFESHAVAGLHPLDQELDQVAQGLI